MEEQKGLSKIWVFTYHGTEEAPPCPAHIVEVKLKALKASFYRFSLERCPETKRLHYQGTVGFETRRANKTLQTRCWAGYWATCRKPEDSVAYCGKSATHVDGPWDFGNLPGSRNYRTGFDKAQEKPWMTDLFKLVDETPEADIPKRQILWYWSENGARGKSSTVAELEDNHHAIVTEYYAQEPLRNLYAIAAVAEPTAVGSKCEQVWDYKAIVLDVPRGAGMDYTILETLCGERFSNTFQRPGRVRLYPCWKIVFANWPPNVDESVMSMDRFKVICVD